MKHHIIDQYRGCRQIPIAVRERVRRADSSSSSAQIIVPPLSQTPQHPTGTSPTLPNVPASSASVAAPDPAERPDVKISSPQIAPTQVLATQVAPASNLHPVGTKRKRQSTDTLVASDDHSRLAAAPAAAPAAVDQSLVPTRLPDELVAAVAERMDRTGVRIAIEFSFPSATLMRATWIAAELIAEFRPHVVDVSLIPRSTENTFNLWIDGIIAWSRGVGQPLPDYDHLRPLLRAKCSNSSL